MRLLQVFVLLLVPCTVQACSSTILIVALAPCVVKYGSDVPFLPILQAPDFNVDGFLITLCSLMSEEDLIGLVTCAAPQALVINCPDQALIALLRLVTPDNILPFCRASVDTFTCKNSTTSVMQSQTCSETFFDETKNLTDVDKCSAGHDLRSCLYNTTRHCPALIGLEIFESVTSQALETASSSCGLPALTRASTTALTQLSSEWSSTAAPSSSSPASEASSVVASANSLSADPTLMLLILAVLRFFGGDQLIMHFGNRTPKKTW